MPPATSRTCLMMAKYDAKNPEALRRLMAAGVQLRQFPRPVLDACYKATFETFDELSAKNEDFKKIYEPWQKFLAEFESLVPRSPRAPWTTTATRCRRSSASFNQTAAVFARCGSLPFWEAA